MPFEVTKGAIDVFLQKKKSSFTLLDSQIKH